MLALTGIRFVFHVCKMFISFYHLGFLIMQHWLNIKGLGKEQQTYMTSVTSVKLRMVWHSH